ncbi:hypothetical protein Q3G72_006216 [Acer saccharum]|nr:hypothetical protein Q3G72_006216 [Acer saccharum]
MRGHSNRSLLVISLVLLLSLSFTIQLAQSEVINLTPDTFSDKVKEKDTLWFVKFCVPWCKHCKKLGSLWEDLGMAMEGEDAIEEKKLQNIKGQEMLSHLKRLFWKKPRKQQQRSKVMMIRNCNNFIRFGSFPVIRRLPVTLHRRIHDDIYFQHERVGLHLSARSKMFLLSSCDQHFV